MKRWLEDLSLGQYAQSFAANDIDFDVLPDLTEAELERLGLSLGHRKRLRKAIAGLGGPTVGQSSPFALAPAAATPAQDAQAERRQMTVMFCDLVGSTEMSERLDPEDLRHTLYAYQQVCTEVIGRFDGFIAQYQGDAILAYFGYPHAHEGEAERAVRCGLAMLTSIAQTAIAAPDAMIELRVRIGIATGPAVVGDLIGRGAAALVTITGRTPNLAARIQEFARPGTLVIADSTRRLVAGQFECERMGAQRLKGLNETVELWQVLRELSDAERFAAKETTQVACVGRDRELGLLLDRWRLTAAGTGQAIVVSGEAGIGKSRLAALLRERLPANAHINIRLECAQQYRNSPLYPLIVHLQRAAGFEADDTPAVKLAKIEQLMAMAGSSDGAPLMAALLSVPFGDRYQPLAMSPARQRAQTRSC